MKTVRSLSINQSINVTIFLCNEKWQIKIFVYSQNNPATSRWRCKLFLEQKTRTSCEVQIWKTNHVIYSATVYREPKQENLTKIILVPRASIKVAKQLPLWMWKPLWGVVNKVLYCIVLYCIVLYCKAFIFCSFIYHLMRQLCSINEAVGKRI